MLGSDGIALDALDLHQQAVFGAIIEGLVHKGYCVVPNALPLPLAEALWRFVQTLPAQKFMAAGVGRQTDFAQNQFVRRDEICWIDGSSPVGQAWLAWAATLQRHINRELFMGLFSFESHFAHYAPGAFYKKHVDAFKGQANRVVSVVVYLNPVWLPDDGGELAIYADDTGPESQAVPVLKVTPNFATVVAFLSEQVPHEVLPAMRDRYSIAGWFRVNTSTANRVDPPK
ncbi:MAG: 2OG-Fe(II) oxygenase [Marinagarivorans sp.]|nr:2OG-Fe(II) oxygenase [Marinagarivorans sp.]